MSNCCIFVFFFKQKTAYEMRISDWSSDVCSSDLDRLHRLTPFFVRNADHRDLLHRRVAEDRAFDLGRIDILAAGDDHVLYPVVDEEIAVGVEIADRKSTRLNSSH